jgi:hypothetical protein
VKDQILAAIDGNDAMDALSALFSAAVTVAQTMSIEKYALKDFFQGFADTAYSIESTDEDDGLDEDDGVEEDEGTEE